VISILDCTSFPTEDYFAKLKCCTMKDAHFIRSCEHSFYRLETSLRCPLHFTFTSWGLPQQNEYSNESGLQFYWSPGFRVIIYSGVDGDVEMGLLLRGNQDILLVVKVIADILLAIFIARESSGKNSEAASILFLSVHGYIVGPADVLWLYCVS
jgi:hypothetical protein